MGKVKMVVRVGSNVGGSGVGNDGSGGGGKLDVGGGDWKNMGFKFEV